MTSFLQWLAALWKTLGASDALITRALRFGMIGLLSGLVFAGVSVLFVRYFSVDPKLASAAGYIASMPVNFAGNRRFSFRSQNLFLGDLARFILVHCCNILLATFATSAIVDLLGLHYIFGIIAVVVLIPCVNFAVMNLWVFRKAAARPSVNQDTSGTSS